MELLEEQIAAWLERHPFAGSAGAWLLAVSGGADSVAMLCALARLAGAGRLTGQRLCVAHLNHGLRGAAADRDESFVRQLAGQYGLACHCATVAVAELARDRGVSIETAGRQARYAFLEETARHEGCGAVAVAHNADDQAETVLHRILRGTGLRGLAGIAPVRPLAGNAAVTLFRPLLDCSRGTIVDYLQTIGQSWCQDATNADPAYTRNRLRHELLPLLRERYNPQVGAALNRLAELARQSAEVVSDALADRCGDLIIECGATGAKLDLAALNRLPEAWRSEAIDRVLHKLNIPLRRLGQGQIERIVRLAGRERIGRQTVSGILAVEQCGGQLTIRPLLPETQAKRPAPTALAAGQTISLPPGFLWYDQIQKTAHPLAALACKLQCGDQSDVKERLLSKPPQDEWIDADTLQGPLVLRVRKPGDGLRPLGSPGQTKLGDLFTNLKIPITCRNRIALACDQKGIIWVAGLKLAERVKISKNTKNILKLCPL